MKKIAKIAVLSLFITNLSSFAQGGWTWTEKANMPMATSNNGIAAVTIGDTTWVYSFAGIDATKEHSGIHTKAFKYNTTTNIWDTIPDLPDSLGGVIALSATTVKDKIYIIGGYHVYANNSEISSYEVHIFDPVTETYSRGANLPTAIDDHVHFSYKDSLIYIITGWSSDLNPDQNTPKVQIYNPALDVWSAGTETPSTNSFMCFGGSGGLVGDTIYYAGGADHSSFGLRSNFRKGVIDANDPTQITWTMDTFNPGDKLYRSAAVSLNNRLFWIGGASVPYNYDGLSYSSNSPVAPTKRILEWNPEKRKFYEHTTTPYQIMDLRGIAQISPTQFIIAGGMLLDTTVSNKTFLLEYDTTYIDPSDTTTNVGFVNIPTHPSGDAVIYPNPATDWIQIEPGTGNPVEITIYNEKMQKMISTNQTVLSTQKLPSGAYYIDITYKNGTTSRKLIFKK